QLPRVVEGLGALRPLTETTRLEGAIFAARMDVGPRQVDQTLVLAQLRPNELIEWESVDDTTRGLRFELRPSADASRTRVLLVVSYEEPSGWKGALSGPIIDQMVRSRARQTLVRLRQHFE
ncbi:MAG: hypothetical protein ACRDV8_04865, partial [Acidimicrobiales bacterium]